MPKVVLPPACANGRSEGRAICRPLHAQASCVHTALLSPAPYYAVWRSGPRALPFRKGDKLTGVLKVASWWRHNPLF